LGSAAGAPLSQTGGSEAERGLREASSQQRQVATEQSAELAAGIGTTDEDQEASDRDADGRMFWENRKSPGEQEAAENPPPQRPAKDPTGISGNTLDLTG
jgi:hypothetical protein